MARMRGWVHRLIEAVEEKGRRERENRRKK